MFFNLRHGTAETHSITISNDSGLAQLYRLCDEYGFTVLEKNDGDTYTLSVIDFYALNEPLHLTPSFPSLEELEKYTTDNLTEILNSYLFDGEPPQLH